MVTCQGKAQNMLKLFSQFFLVHLSNIPAVNPLSSFFSPSSKVVLLSISHKMFCVFVCQDCTTEDVKQPVTKKAKFD